LYGSDNLDGHQLVPLPVPSLNDLAKGALTKEFGDLICCDVSMPHVYRVLTHTSIRKIGVWDDDVVTVIVIDLAIFRVGVL
jgi:hypothetical protein